MTAWNGHRPAKFIGVLLTAAAFVFLLVGFLGGKDHGRTLSGISLVQVTPGLDNVIVSQILSSVKLTAWGFCVKSPAGETCGDEKDIKSYVDVLTGAQSLLPSSSELSSIVDLLTQWLDVLKYIQGVAFASLSIIALAFIAGLFACGPVDSGFTHAAHVVAALSALFSVLFSAATLAAAMILVQRATKSLVKAIPSAQVTFQNGVGLLAASLAAVLLATLVFCCTLQSVRKSRKFNQGRPAFLGNRDSMYGHGSQRPGSTLDYDHPRPASSYADPQRPASTFGNEQQHPATTYSQGPGSPYGFGSPHAAAAHAPGHSYPQVQQNGGQFHYAKELPQPPQSQHPYNPGY